MKVAFLIERLNPRRGGAETYAADFTRQLLADGHEVHVFSRESSVVPEGVTLRPVKVSGVGRSWRTFSFAHRVRKMLSHETFDVVHAVGWTYSQDVFQPHGGVHRAMLVSSRLWCGFLGGLAREFRQDFSPKEVFYRVFEWVQYRRRPPRVFVALSEMVKTFMVDFHRVPPERIEVVYNGVDTGRFHPTNREAHRTPIREKYGIADDEVVFLVVAHNFRLKGVPELVECVTGDFPPCRLLVVGRNRLAGKLEALAESRAPGRVIFTGAVPDTAPYYAAADVYVHPTYYDPCSLVVLEALASGLPVVTTWMNGAGELIGWGREGFVVAPPSPHASMTGRNACPPGIGGRTFLSGTFEETGETAPMPDLAACLRELFDPELRRTMGAAARTLAENHTLRHNYRQMMTIYDRVARTKEDE